MMNPDRQRWTPELVEDFLFRKFDKDGSDTEVAYPPMPEFNPNSFDVLEIPDCAKHLFKFIETGPAPAALASKNTNTATAAPGTPMKGHSSFAPKTPNAAAKKPLYPLPKTPKEKEKSKAPSEAPSQSQKQKVNDSRDTSMSQMSAASEANRKRHRDPTVSPTPSAKSTGSNADASAKKKQRPEGAIPRLDFKWPAHVPTNAELKGESRSKLVPWTLKRIRAQDTVDPDLIFAQPEGDLPLSQIFARFPAAVARCRQARGLSGDWRDDTFTREEERQYKEELGLKHLGPSQAGERHLF